MATPRYPYQSILWPLVLGAWLVLNACSDDPSPATGGPDASADANEDLADMSDDPGCNPGSEGCACLAGGTCDAADDDGNALVCSSGNVCVEEGATDCTGELGCVCGAGDVCDSGLTCEGGVCALGSGLVLTIEAGDARACDLRLETTRDVVGAFFPEGVRGELRARDGVAAIALMRTTDTALGGNIATIAFEGDVAADAEVVTSLSTTCYGRLGALDAAAVPTVETIAE